MTGAAMMAQAVEMRPQLLAYARRRTRSPEDAEDVVQDALEALLVKPPAARSLRGWLHTVVRNRAIDTTRRRRLEQLALDQLWQLGGDLAG